MENFLRNQTIFSLISFVRSISYRAHLTIIFSLSKVNNISKTDVFFFNFRLSHQRLISSFNFENSSFQFGCHFLWKKNKLKQHTAGFSANFHSTPKNQNQ